MSEVDALYRQVTNVGKLEGPDAEQLRQIAREMLAEKEAAGEITKAERHELLQLLNYRDQ